MMANLIFLAETQWDMRSPIENYALLSKEQKQFNQQQQQLRQVSRGKDAQLNFEAANCSKSLELSQMGCRNLFPQKQL